MNEQFRPLMEPLRLRSGQTVKNRVAMAPMTNFSSNEDGTVSSEELQYYARRSAGAGMVITACTYVTPSGKGFPGEFAADHDGMIGSLRKLAEEIKAQGALAVLQIFHGGRNCPPALVPDGDVVSASDVPSEQNGGHQPRPLTEDEILEIIAAFGETTRRAIEAGFDGVEIHGANGYLLQQFFSPHTNRRGDAWGGSLENRIRFPLAVLDAVQGAVAAHAKEPFLVGYRFSPEEEETPGITMVETLELVDRLADRELDYLHISLMDHTSRPRRGADESRSRIEWIVERIAGRVPLIGVGSIRTPQDALAALQAGSAMAAIGRELIIDPEWVQKVQEGRESEIETVLSREDRERLDVPVPLWNVIVNTPGWFPIGD